MATQAMQSPAKARQHNLVGEEIFYSMQDFFLKKGQVREKEAE